MKEADIARFWSKVDKGNGPDDCWIWQAGTNPKGYGNFRLCSPRRKEGAHRIAYKLRYGEIPEGMCVCHRCDTPRCCNPAHLFIGTQADNAQDRAAKGRGWKPSGERSIAHLHPEVVLRGEAHPMAKLTVAEVRAIRAGYYLGHQTQAAIAKTYGVSRSLIGVIVRGEIWRYA